MAIDNLHSTSDFVNKLIDSTSPYLLQHAHNPVNWYPWGPEAIELARQQDKPIFLSIGYSSCHWCHVMAHEVFENPQIAKMMNEAFINIKVDREERPDLDELYMLATQLVSGSGGWPMSVWLTPELKPFYAGTYFPPEDRYGRPGFPSVIHSIREAWHDRRAEINEQANRIVENIQLYAEKMQSNHNAPVDLSAWIKAALQGHADSFDPDHGGLGSAPKFPPSQSLKLWLSMLRLIHQPGPAGAPQPDLPPALAALGQSPTLMHLIRDMVVKTLDGMMQGGIYDHVGGGFARYSVDESWHVPHFEKMLYDNAQLAPVYAMASVQLGRRDYERIARQTLDFWLREMTSPEGAFYSTIDADSEGHEGKYYVWTLADLAEALPDSGDRQLIMNHFGMTEAGNWHESPVAGGNVLGIVRSAGELAPDYNTTPELLQQRIDRLLLAMRKYRGKRVMPAVDDKILTGWNGLMISAMAVAGRTLREPRYLEAAHRAIGYLLLRHMEQGRTLMRVSRKGRAQITAYLEDHAYLLNGLMDLIDATSPTSLPGTMARKRALELADTLIRLFEDREHGGFYMTHAGHDSPLVRFKTLADNATPSANALAIRSLLRLAQHSGKEIYREVATRATQSFAGMVSQDPAQFPTLLRSLLEDAHWLLRQPLVAATALTPEGHTPSGSMPESVMTLSADPVPPLHTGDSFDVKVTLKIADGYHISPGGQAGRDVLATVVRMRTDMPIGSQEWTLPDPEKILAGPAEVLGMKGTVVILSLIHI